MKKFILKLLLFFIPLILGAIVLELLVRTVPNDYSYKNRYLENHAAELEILVLGSSHTFYGINPEYFQVNAFNAAHVSQGLSYDYLLFNKFNSRCSNLKAVVLPVSYFSLFGKLEDEVERWRVKYYSIYYGCSPSYALPDRFEVLGARTSTLLREVVEYVLSGGDKTRRTVSDLGHGVRSWNDPLDQLEESGKAAAKRHTAGEWGYQNLSHNLEALEKLVSDCNDRQIEVFLFMPPAWKSYVEHLDADQLALIQRHMEQIMEKYGNVQYYSFLSDDRFLAEDYADADHLNATGAKKLTTLIDGMLIQPSM